MIFAFWLTSLSMIVSGSIHVISFLKLSGIPLYIYITSSLSIHLSMDAEVASISWQL